MGLNSLRSQMLNATAISTEPPTPPAEQTHGPSSRPTLGFPLGTAMLLLVVFCLSGVFSCCYHWDKLRRLRGRIPFLPPADGSAEADGDHGDSPHADLPSPPSKPNQHAQVAMQGKETDSLTVIMPGGQIPTYIAWPCPCPPPASQPPPGPLLPSPPVKFVVVDIVTPPPSYAAAPRAVAPSSPP